MKDKFIKMAVLRILKSEKKTIMSGVHDKWQKIITSLVAQFGGETENPDDGNLHKCVACYLLCSLYLFGTISRNFSRLTCSN